jgi:cytoskeletal protein CcmA (bactofilin family)
MVAGQVTGAIHAKDRIELQATAQVAGDIHTPRIAIVEGARVSGEVKMDVAGQPSLAAGDTNRG